MHCYHLPLSYILISFSRMESDSEQRDGPCTASSCMMCTVEDVLKLITLKLWSLKPSVALCPSILAYRDKRMHYLQNISPSSPSTQKDVPLLTAQCSSSAEGLTAIKHFHEYVSVVSNRVLLNTHNISLLLTVLHCMLSSDALVR